MSYVYFKSDLDKYKDAPWLVTAETVEDMIEPFKTKTEAINHINYLNGGEMRHFTRDTEYYCVKCKKYMLFVDCGDDLYCKHCIDNMYK